MIVVCYNAVSNKVHKDKINRIMIKTLKVIKNLECAALMKRSCPLKHQNYMKKSQ